MEIEHSHPKSTAPDTPPAIALFTDGACSGNPGPGGCAAVLVCNGHRKELAQGFRRTTNNRMELSAVLLGLRSLQRRCRVEIHTDSKYVVGAFQEGWIRRWKVNGWRTSARKPVLNVDLWKALEGELAKHETHFTWVKGHAGHEENTRCDVLAVAASKGTDFLVDAEFERDNPLPSDKVPAPPTVKLGETFELF